MKDIFHVKIGNEGRLILLFLNMKNIFIAILFLIFLICHFKQIFEILV